MCGSSMEIILQRTAHQSEILHCLESSNSSMRGNKQPETGRSTRKREFGLGSAIQRTSTQNHALHETNKQSTEIPNIQKPAEDKNQFTELHNQQYSIRLLITPRYEHFKKFNPIYSFNPQFYTSAKSLKLLFKHPRTPFSANMNSDSPNLFPSCIDKLSTTLFYKLTIIVNDTKT